MKDNNNPNPKLQDKLDNHEFIIPESSWEDMKNILDGYKPVPSPSIKPTASWFKAKVLGLSGVLIASTSIGLLAVSVYILKTPTTRNDEVTLSNFNISVQKHELGKPEENLENGQKNNDGEAIALNEAMSRGTNQETGMKTARNSQSQWLQTIAKQQQNEENTEQHSANEKEKLINVAVVASTGQEGGKQAAKDKGQLLIQDVNQIAVTPDTYKESSLVDESIVPDFTLSGQANKMPSNFKNEDANQGRNIESVF